MRPTGWTLSYSVFGKIHRTQEVYCGVGLCILIFFLRKVGKLEMEVKWHVLNKE